MIIVRSPLRISLGGGGTDLPSYYEKNEGFLISAAIDKYIYITLNENFEKEILIKYSKIEHCKHSSEIKHFTKECCILQSPLSYRICNRFVIKQ